MARYVELSAAQRAAGQQPAIGCLRDLKPSASEVADKMLSDVLASLESARLGEQKRVAFYAVGAAIALLLDETSPAWKTKYFEQPFLLEAYFSP